MECSARGVEPRMRTTRQAQGSIPFITGNGLAALSLQGGHSLRTSQEVNLGGQGQDQPSVTTDKELSWNLSSTAAPEPPETEPSSVPAAPRLQLHLSTPGLGQEQPEPRGEEQILASLKH